MAFALLAARLKVGIETKTSITRDTESHEFASQCAPAVPMPCHGSHAIIARPEMAENAMCHCIRCSLTRSKCKQDAEAELLKIKKDCV